MDKPILVTGGTGTLAGSLLPVSGKRDGTSAC